MVVVLKELTDANLTNYYEKHTAYYLIYNIFLMRQFVENQMPGWRWTGEIDSPILGTEGNKEFLCHLKNDPGTGKSRNEVSSPV